MASRRLLRLQHSQFGSEIRALLRTRLKRDQELAGIIVDELGVLQEKKEQGQRHPDEDRLEDDLSPVGYLRLYPPGHSVRVYFTVIDGVMWMLALVTSKRRTKLLDSEKKMLHQRLREVREEHKRRQRQ